MDKLTEDTVREIEQIHSSWIEFEVAGEGHRLMTLCADDIELLPPDAQPVLGRAAVSARLAHGNTRIHDIEITNRLIRGSNGIAYLTANYKTTFSSPEDSTHRQTLGSHLWILQKRAGTWVIALVSWSLWGAISGPTAHALRAAKQARIRRIIVCPEAPESRFPNRERYPSWRTRTPVLPSRRGRCRGPQRHCHNQAV